MEPGVIQSLLCCAAFYLEAIDSTSLRLLETTASVSGDSSILRVLLRTKGNLKSQEHSTVRVQLDVDSMKLSHMP